MLVVEALSKSYEVGQRERHGSVAAVAAVDLTVEHGQLFTIVGPSGCGKTTTLRCIAGLERPDAGTIRVGDTVVFSSADGIDVPSNQRGLGMVFQSYAIWPHMDVFANVAFPLRVKPRAQRPARAVIHDRVRRALAAVQLEDLERRPATDLSSGQQQRVALARALVTEPPLLLLDEPLSNIDAKLREEMRAELVRVQRELGITTIYVTHDQLEALALSDVVAVMNAGEVEQVGPPRDVYERPASAFVADFVGSSNLLAGDVRPGSDGVVVTEVGELRLGAAATRCRGRVDVAVRPEHLVIAGPVRPPEGAWFEARGVIESTAYLGDVVDHLVRVGGTRLRVREPVRAAIAPGTHVVVLIPREHCVVLAHR